MSTRAGVWSRRFVGDVAAGLVLDVDGAAPVRRRGALAARLRAVVAVGLVATAFVVWDPYHAPAMANSTAAGLARNSWIIADLAMNSGGAYAGTNTNVGGAPVNVLQQPTRSMPTTPVPANAGKAAGFKLRGRGWAGALLTLGGFVGLDLLLAGDGAPDPVDVLPTPTSGDVPAGWTLMPYTETPEERFDITNVTVSADGNVVTVEAVGVRKIRTSSASASSVALRCRGGISQTSWQMVVPASVGTYPLSRTISCGTGGVVDYVSKSPTGTWTPGVGYVPGTEAVWYPPGDPRRPPDTTADPAHVEHEAGVRVRCEDAAGASVWVESFTSFTIAQLREGIVPTIPEVQCPDGHWAAEAKPEIHSPDGTGGTVTTPLSDAEAAPSQELIDRAPGLVGETDPGLELKPKGQPTSCFDLGRLCDGWWQDPTKEVTYECTDGGVVVALTRCAILKDAFKPGGTITDPSADTDPDGAPTDAEGRQCWPTGWGKWNPLEWVYRPVRCALEWAFIPAEPLDTSPVRSAVATSGIGQMSSFVNGLFGALSFGEGTCGQIANAPIEAFNGGRIVVDTCEEPWPSFAPIRRVLGLGFVAGAVIVGVYSVTRVIRVAPATKG